MAPVWAGWPRSNIIVLSAKQYQILSNEGVQILLVKPNHGPHQFLCSPQGSSPVKIKHASIFRTLRIAAQTASRMARLSLLMVMAISAVAALAQTSADHRTDSGHRQPAHPQGNHPRPPLYASRRYLRSGLHRARLQFPLEHRVLRGPAYRARRYGEGHHPECLRPRKTHHSRDQLQGQQLHQQLRYSGPLQEGEGRPLGGRPV